MDNIPTWKAVTISVGVALLVALLVQVILVPIQRRKIMGQPVHFTFGDSDGEYWPLTVPLLRLPPLHARVLSLELVDPTHFVRHSHNAAEYGMFYS